MLSWLKGAITSRAAGPIAAVVAAALAVVLAASWLSWEASRAGYEARIADLSRQAERSQSLWKAQLAACHASSGSQRVATASAAVAPASGEDPAELLERQPEGIDACARMESADQAVLSNLK